MGLAAGYCYTPTLWARAHYHEAAKTWRKPRNSAKNPPDRGMDEIGAIIEPYLLRKIKRKVDAVQNA